MTRGFKVAVAGLAVIALLGFAKKDLSRSEATSLITVSGGTQVLRREVPLVPEYFDIGRKAGLGTLYTDEARHTNGFSRLGSKYFESVLRSVSLAFEGPNPANERELQIPELHEPDVNALGVLRTSLDPPQIEVSGIAKDSETKRTVTFRWRYVNVPAEIAMVVASGGEAEAGAQLFDDGWRVVAMRVVRYFTEPVAAENIRAAQGEDPAQATVSALRTLAVSVEAYSVDYMFYPKVASGEAGKLSSNVTPTYIKRLPDRDGWGSPFYWIGDEREGRGYTFYSVGADRKRDPEWGYGTTTDPNKDIVFSNGQFVQWPQGLQPD